MKIAKVYYCEAIWPKVYSEKENVYLTKKNRNTLRCIDPLFRYSELVVSQRFKKGKQNRNGYPICTYTNHNFTYINSTRSLERIIKILFSSLILCRGWKKRLASIVSRIYFVDSMNVYIKYSYRWNRLYGWLVLKIILDFPSLEFCSILILHAIWRYILRWCDLLVSLKEVVNEIVAIIKEIVTMWWRKQEDKMNLIYARDKNLNYDHNDRCYSNEFPEVIQPFSSLVSG